MKAYVFHGPGRSAREDVPDPGVKEAADALVRADAVTLCGTDLHILKGDVPEVRPGTVLGHEAVGEVGGDVRTVRTVRPCGRVLVSCITACGRYRPCRAGMYGQCRGGGGWIPGHLVDGTQAEYVRAPHADLAAHPLPSALDGKDAELLADIFPASCEVGVLNGHVRPGDTNRRRRRHPARDGGRRPSARRATGDAHLPAGPDGGGVRRLPGPPTPGRSRSSWARSRTRTSSATGRPDEGER